jgi:hypothetical protein
MRSIIAALVILLGVSIAEAQQPLSVLCWAHVPTNPLFVDAENGSPGDLYGCEGGTFPYTVPAGQMFCMTSLHVGGLPSHYVRLDLVSASRPTRTTLLYPGAFPFNPPLDVAAGESVHVKFKNLSAATGYMGAVVQGYLTSGTCP